MNDLQLPVGARSADRANALPIYLDNQASTPLDPRVLEAMLPYFTEHFGNPHSESHVYGRNAMAAIDAARADIARLIHADPREIVFTSGATEANNLAIKGAAHFARAHPPASGPARDHIVTLTTEHKCVLEGVAALEREGFPVTFLPVMESGLVDLAVLAAAITEKTLLVSVMAAHNEIGVIQPLAEIGALCRSRGVLFHTDAAQAAGKIPLDVEAMKIDLMSISGHKMYGPKGIGALYIRRGPRIASVMDGGEQERGRRAGTLNVPGIVGLGRAVQLAQADREAESGRLSRLRDRLIESIETNVPGACLQGARNRRLPGNVHFCIEGVEGESLLLALDMAGVYASAGSACTTGSVEPSHVLLAMGVEVALARGALRLTLGRTTTEEAVDYTAERLKEIVGELRSLA